MGENMDWFEKSDRVFMLLRESLSGAIMKILAGSQTRKEKEELLKDFYWYTNQSNIGAITSQLALNAIAKLLHNEEYRLSRWDFLANTTAYLKLRLGKAEWANLISHIIDAVSCKFDQTEESGDVDTANRLLLQVNKDIINSNDVIAVIILLAIMPDTTEIITHYRMNLQQPVTLNPKRMAQDAGE